MFLLLLKFELFVNDLEKVIMFFLLLKFELFVSDIFVLIFVIYRFSFCF